MSTASSKLYGIFGGTFDPVHLGHLRPVEQAAKQLRITQVALMPCYLPPHKAAPGTSVGWRWQLVQQACEEYPLFVADDRELRAESRSYTVLTLRALRQEQPHKHLCFFIGMDSLKAFDQWYEWQEILTLCHLIVCRRGDETAQFSDTMQHILATHQCDDPEQLHTQKAGCIYLAETDALAISSTAIRASLARGDDVSECLPTGVARLIEQHRLYQNAGSDKLQP